MLMSDNHSAHGVQSLASQISHRVVVVQVLIALFLFINSLLIMTFFKKEHFHTNMRYIFFANTLISDCLFLLMSNVLLILTYFRIPMPIWLCICMYMVLMVYTLVTPFTLTAMTLERYVAVCIPLRHAALCTPRSARNCIVIIHCLSAVPGSVTLSVFFAVAARGFYTSLGTCSVEKFFLHRWQNYLRSSLNLFCSLLMAVSIAFSYVEIMRVARVASAENRRSSWKGLRTVSLHAFQLILSLTQLWAPFVEATVLQIDLMMYINVRYFNYIAFFLVPRCLSPLVYGLRDEKFFMMLKYYALFGLYKKMPVLLE